MDKYIRYELSVEGALQDVGFLVGLNDCDLQQEEIDALLENFNKHLNIVDFKSLNIIDKSAKFYFTEDGDKKFKEDIEKIKMKIESLGLFKIERIEVFLSPTDEKIFYEDKYQCLIKL